ncbi:cysteine-rich CWC family protein [Lampropedia aestuarii]|uniref:cysteine-rich CWC family protein n=1 Tax=Lampropedia aestuarii TaxID=2562762 RepID=UPI001F0D55C5|nr:cysteine-rich CWC family protein [Lampropedia aestuarii]MDH5858891.1 cysteine-rich CWC family protein [Lampropedia aestuarii]
MPDPASLCPLCGTANRCAISAGANPSSCWCMQTAIAPAALAQASAMRTAGTPASQCLCPTCGAVTDTSSK